MIDNPTNCPPQVRVGDIKAFAAARPAWQNRLAVAPEIPTV
jgi:tripartite-type tricarboxylate transporter receptor subunit TctC